MNRYQELTFLGEEETFFGKKLVIELALEVAAKMRAPATKIKAPLSLPLFLASLCLSHNQDQPAKVCINMDHLILPEGFGFYARAGHLLWGSLYACLLLTLWM